jgi:hypothetical protein
MKKEIEFRRSYSSLILIILIIVLFILSYLFGQSPSFRKEQILITTIGLTVLIIITTIYLITYIISDKKKITATVLLTMALGTLLIILLFAQTYRANGIYDSRTKQCKVTSFSDTLYFSIVTWTTLGYGDFQPEPGSRIYASIEALIGYIYMGLYVGVLVKVIFKDKK